MERVYVAEPENNLIDSGNIQSISNVVAKSIIKEKYHAINDQWNDVHQADLEGYILIKENNQLVAYKIYGFGEDSLIDLNTPFPLSENVRLSQALLHFCENYFPENNERISPSVFAQLIS